jgi:hypothetical protein
MGSGEAVKEFLGTYPAGVRDLALGARRLVLECIRGAEETLDAPGRVIGYGFGAGYSGVVCTLLLSKTGVKLGLVRGAELPDPKQLLEGSGKVHRYVQLKTLADLETPGLKSLIKASHAAWKHRTPRGG